MDTRVPFVPLGCPTCPACPSHGGQTGQSCGHTHMYHCTWQSCLSCPSHVGWTGQSRGHTHVYHLTCLCPACPVLYMWDGQDSPMDIHTCVPLHLAVLSFPCGTDSTVPWTHTHVPLYLSCPSHVGWTGQSRGHTHMYRSTCLLMWDGQHCPMDIHTCTTAIGKSYLSCPSHVGWTALSTSKSDVQVCHHQSYVNQGLSTLSMG